MRALVNDIVDVRVVEDVRTTSGVLVLVTDAGVVKNSSSLSSSFSSTSSARIFGSYSVVSMEKSPEPEPLPVNTSSEKKKSRLKLKMFGNKID